MLEERKNAGECNICSCIDFYDPQLDFIPHSSKAIYPSIVPYTNEAHLSFLCVLKIHPLDIYTSFSLRAPSLARDETSSTHAIVSSCNSCPLHFSVEKKRDNSKRRNKLLNVFISWINARKDFSQESHI